MKRNPGMRTFDFSKKGYSFTGSCLIPNKKHDAIAVGAGPKNRIWQAYEGNSVKSKVSLSQIKILHTGRAFFTGACEEGKTGSIQIWKFPLEKINECQAHGKGISRMNLTYDGKFLLSAGKDGTIMIHDVKDRDIRGQELERAFDYGVINNFAEEILTEKTAMEQYEAQQDSLETELNQVKNNNMSSVDEKMSTKDQEDTLIKLREEYENIDQ